MKKFLVLMSAVLALTACGAPATEVQFRDCTRSATSDSALINNYTFIKVTVKNNASTARSINVMFNVLDKNHIRVGHGTAHFSDVAPGAIAARDSMTYIKQQGIPITCEVIIA